MPELLQPERMLPASHHLIDAITDTEGQESAFLLSRLVDGFRRNQIQMDSSTTTIVRSAEAVVCATGCWGDYIPTLHTVIDVATEVDLMLDAVLDEKRVGA